jgi:UrcA family protein
MNASVTPRIAGNRVKTALLLLTGGLICGLSLGAASAATIETEAPSMVVRYSNGSLSTDSGVQHLYRQIVNAANHVCPEESRIPAANAQAKACRAQAIERAVQRIGNTRLASYAGPSKIG